MIDPFKVLAAAHSAHPHPDLQEENRIDEGADRVSGGAGTTNLGIQFLNARNRTAQ